MSRGQAGMGGMPGGARSGTGEGPMSPAMRRTVLGRLILGDFTSAANALEQESLGNYYTSEDRLLSMSAMSALEALAYSPSLHRFADNMALKFDQAGYGRDRDVIKFGSQRERSERLGREMKNLLSGKPLMERTTEELKIIASQFELLTGLTIGKEPDALTAAIGSLCTELPGLKQLMKGGTTAPSIVLNH